ncbi:MAG TPA: YaiI/YqxD family protein [Candidatus Polarisedimenticolia bacterium]|nr:YaiI/YqxD family protein [Candidatus Polarisedimenticolia bacterium]
MLDIYIDADGCPVKEETYKIARRHDLRVVVVSNQPIRIPMDERYRLQVVGDRLDEVDDWIAGHAATDDIVITADIPLASRCLENGAVVVNPRGGEFTEDNIGSALANRELMSHLRDIGEKSSGPAPFQPADRSRFLHKLDEAIRGIRKRRLLRKRTTPDV